MALAGRGEQRPFELLFQRHRAGIHAYAVRMLGDHAAAEDVVQDVFVSAMRSLRNGTEPVHVRAWLQEIARCACVDHWRGSERRREISYDAPESLSGKDARRMVVSGDAAMRGATDRESLACLRSAFQDLPELQHRVLVQRELEGRSPSEIAERLGISPTAVEGQLARGRRSLADSFRELQSGERCVATRELCEVSLERPLGVRDRARVRVHLRTCVSCRRHARAAGVEPRLFDPRVLGNLGFLLPLPLLRRFPLTSIFASSESLGVAVTGKALVGAAVIAAGGGGALVAGDFGPSRDADPGPVAHSAESPTAVAADAQAVRPGGTSPVVLVSAASPLGPIGGPAEMRLAVAELPHGAPSGSAERDDERSERRHGDAQGAVTSGVGQREALAGAFPTPLILPRFVPSVPPRVERLAPVPDGPEYSHGGDGGSTGTRGGKQLPSAPSAGTKIVADPADTDPVNAPEPLPEAPPVVEEPPIEEPPVTEEPPVEEPPVTDPGSGGSTPPVDGVVEPAPGGTDAGTAPVPAPSAPGETGSVAPVESSTGEQG